MKTLTISAFLLAVAIATSSFVLSNQYVDKAAISSVENIGSFRVHRQGKDVALTWTGMSNGVAQYYVERSYDGEFYDVIGAVDNTNASSYKFQDESVPPGYLYYRVCGVDANGVEQEMTGVEVIRIVQRK
ncbi:MAG TPA: hypothetical protein VFL47_09980 [Flavisolibacter sp.]|nr:hypothetical protein [Flavisolibacter sp.]